MKKKILEKYLLPTINYPLSTINFSPMSGYLEAVRYVPKVFNKKDALPFFLIHFITEVCNAHCNHCLCGNDEFTHEGELTVDEIDQFTRKADPFLFVFLTGGEPFLRRDIVEIASCYYKNARTQKFQIPSNGSQTDFAVSAAEQMAMRCPNAHISVSISLDAVGKLHDENRNFPGLWDKATYTFKELQKLEKHLPNFNTNITITVSKKNQDYVKDVYHYAKDVLGARNIFNTLVRRGARDTKVLDVDISKFDELNRLIDTDLEKRELRGYQKFAFAHMIDAKNLMSRTLISEIAKEPKYRIPCYAGHIAAVLYSKGNVYPCEMLEEPYGNIRDHEYDLAPIWFGEAAMQSKERILKDKCFCTHECFITYNLLFNPRTIPKLLWKYAELHIKDLVG